MELYDQYGSLEEWVTQRRVLHPWQTTDPIDELMSFHDLLSTSNGVTPYNYSDTNLGPTSVIFPDPCFDGFSTTLFKEASAIDAAFNPFVVSQFSDLSCGVPLSAPTNGDSSSYSPFESYPLPSVMEEEVEPHDVFYTDDLGTLEVVATATTSSCKAEPVVSPERVPVLVGQKNRSRRVEGQPSKNLMAERRRRKRLNDRLSMLRSIVPKISKVIKEFLKYIYILLSNF